MTTTASLTTTSGAGLGRRAGARAVDAVLLGATGMAAGVAWSIHRGDAIHDRITGTDVVRA